MEQIEQSLLASEGYLNALIQEIKGNVALQFAGIIPGVNTIVSSIENGLQGAENAIAVAANIIKAQISSQVQGLIPDAISIVTHLTNSLDTYLGQLVNNIATTEDVVTSAITILKANAPQLAGWLFENV